MDFVTAALFSLNFSRRQEHTTLDEDLKLFLRPLAKTSTQLIAALTQLTLESNVMTRFNSFTTGAKSPGSILGTDAFSFSERRASRLVDHFVAFSPVQKSSRSDKI